MDDLPINFEDFREMESSIKLKYISTEEKNENASLKNISFSIDRGESIAILRSNYKDESFNKLRELLVGSLQPSSGIVRITELVNDLGNLTTLFHSNASGRKNIYMCCSALGMDKLEVDVIEDDIINLSGLEQCIDDSVKHYSEEMRSQLALAISFFLKGKILIFDQTLQIENEEYLQKTKKKIEEFLHAKGTFVLFTDSIQMARNLCSRGMLIQNGHLVVDDIIDSTLEALQISAEG